MASSPTRDSPCTAAIRQGRFPSDRGDGANTMGGYNAPHSSRRSAPLSFASPPRPPAPRAPRTTLDIYVIDVEGGNATLFVAPSGEPAHRYRQRRRRRTRRVADHGGVRRRRPHADRSSDHHALARRSLRRHGRTGEAHSDPRVHRPRPQPAARRAADTFLAEVYPPLYAKGTHTVPKPGDKIPVHGLDMTVVTSNGEPIQNRPLRGRADPTPPAPASFRARTLSRTRSRSAPHRLWRFRTMHLGDVTWNKERDLMCPNNPVGTVDLFVVSITVRRFRIRPCSCTPCSRASAS